MADIDTHFHETESELLTELEGTLVREFRTCRALQELVKQERNLLMAGDVENLSRMVEEKEILLDQLNQIEEHRRLVIGKLTDHYEGLTGPTPLSELIRCVDQPVSKRLEHLYAGIGTVIEQVREFNHGNQALALNGLKRVDAVQAYLLDLFQKPGVYQPPGGARAMEPALVWDVDQRT
jgi:flagellar biosynthesis/type III secretory pathway chaperone